MKRLIQEIISKLCGFLPQFFSVCLLLGSSKLAFAQNKNKPGSPPQVLIDGQIEDREWGKAGKFNTADSFTVYIQQDQHYLYIAVKDNRPRIPAFYTDLFFKVGDEILALHASFQIGELTLKQFSDTTGLPYAFGNHVLWTANEVKGKKFRIDPKQPIESQIYPYQGFEFQLDKRKFHSKNSPLLLYIEISSFEGGVSQKHFPQNANRSTIKNWKLIENH